MNNEVQADADASNTARLQSNASLSEYANFRAQQLSPIKIIDFDKNKQEEKERVKIMEKKGIKNMKIRFFN